MTERSNVSDAADVMTVAADGFDLLSVVGSQTLSF